MSISPNVASCLGPLGPESQGCEILGKRYGKLLTDETASSPAKCATPQALDLLEARAAQASKPGMFAKLDRDS